MRRTSAACLTRSPWQMQRSGLLTATARLVAQGEAVSAIEVRFADQTLVTQAINGDPFEPEFACVLPSGDSFTFTVHGVYGSSGNPIDALKVR